jgi:sigma-B regulation protein RsbU (phosphoserine phosphatase)
MKIQNRLSFLFLLLALLPLLVVAFFHYSSMRNLSGEIGAEVQKRLTRTERDVLQKTVQDYGRILERDRKAMENAAQIQARAAERLLATPPPPEPEIYFPEDFDPSGHALPGMTLSYKHMRLSGSRDSQGLLWVNYRHPVLFMPQGENADRTDPDLARLSGLLDTYRFVYQSNSDLVYWQRTVLESGLLCGYPAHAEFPEEFDPRKETWYRRCKKTGKTVWIFNEGTAAKDPAQVVAAPVHGPGGSFAGASAVIVSFADTFRAMQLPFSLASTQEAEAMLVRYAPGEKVLSGKLEILVHTTGREFDSLAPQSPEGRHRYINPEGSAQYGALLQEVAAGEPGVQRISRNGRELIYAYGGHRPGESFPLIVLPYDQIRAQADAVQELVRARTTDWLTFTGLILLGAILLSMLLAYFASRSVVRPVRSLVAAAERLSGGDYSSRVHIDSGDELQDLGDVFNDMCPKLQERENMRHALSIARQTQQHLLPERAPTIKHYDISGKSLYSGETGGDYYDFIELPQSGTEKLGIAVGDISGHGLGSALLMASARGVIRSHAGRYSEDLSRLFGTLNSNLVKDCGESRFLTLFYGILDSGSHELLWASAGHDPALWYRAATGEIRELPNTGMPLGISPEAAYGKAGPIRMQEGDVVLVGTDGIRETRNHRREMFGRARLKRILAWSAHLTSRELCEEISASLTRFRQEATQEDDVTMVVIKRQTIP